MKKVRYVLILISFFLVISCATATHGPFYIRKPYGAPCPYGEGIHPGIDFRISTGTPIIAPSDGKVNYIAEPKESYAGGLFVSISHGIHFDILYGHLSKVFVEEGQSLKRGQLIALSGAGNSGIEVLHFGICKKGGSCKNYSQTHNPDEFWLGGKPQCFDPNKDYSNYSQEEITLPVACGDYAKALKSKIKKKD